MKENGLIRELMLISIFMTSETGKKIIIIHIFPDISRNKGKKTVKFG